MMRPPDISPLSRLLLRADSGAGEKPANTVTTGFPSLDKILGGGFRRGDLIVLGGDVSSGKSALALAIALRCSQSGGFVSFRTSEMSPERVMERVLAIEGRVCVDDLRREPLDDVTRTNAGAAAVRLRSTMPLIEPIPWEIVKSAFLPTRDPRKQFDLVVVDSLNATVRGVTTKESEATTVRELKQVAMEANVPVLLVAGLPGLTARPDPRPILDDFGARGAVKDHADVVLGLFREEMYDPANGNAGATELVVRKNRNGGTGYVDLYFYSQWMRFEDMLDPDR